jgi:hypothetical protein
LPPRFFFSRSPQTAWRAAVVRPSSAVRQLLFFASSSSQPSANLIQRGLRLHIAGD